MRSVQIIFDEYFLNELNPPSSFNISFYVFLIISDYKNIRKGNFKGKKIQNEREKSCF